MANRSPVQTHPHWGTYATAADLPNVSGAGVQSDDLELGDTAFVSATGKLYTCIRKAQGEASWQVQGRDESDDELVFEWNRVDATQFSSVPDYETPGEFASTSLAFLGNGGEPYASILEMRADPNNTAVTKAVCWLANDPIPFTGERRNLRVQIRYRQGGSQGRFPGIWFLCDTSTPTFHGCFHGQVVNSTTHLIAKQQGAANPDQSVQRSCWSDKWSGMWNLYMQMDKPAAASPRFWITGYSPGDGNNGAANFVQTEYTTAFSASWNTLSCLRWGLGVFVPINVGTLCIARMLGIRMWMW